MTPEALKLLLKARPIAFHRIFATIAGGALPGLFLSQCWYWSGHTTEPDSWFYKSRQEWEAETGMTRNEQESSRAALRKIGVLDERQNGGTDRRVWFHVNGDRLIELVQIACENPDALPKTTRNSAPKSAENPPIEGAKSRQSIGGKSTDGTDGNKPIEWWKYHRC